MPQFFYVYSFLFFFSNPSAGLFPPFDDAFCYTGITTGTPVPFAVLFLQCGRSSMMP